VVSATFLHESIQNRNSHPIAEAMQDDTNSSMTSLYTIDRETGDVSIFPAQGDGFCVYHHANSFDFPNGSLAVDFVRHDTCSLMTTLYLDTMLHRPDIMTKMMKQGHLTRCIAHPGAKELECWELSAAPFEFPWFNPGFKTKPYGYVWGLGLLAETGGAYYNVVHKMALDEQGRASVEASWSQGNGTVLTEAIFVPEGRGQEAGERELNEDGGFLFTVAFDTLANRSSLVVLNASSMEAMLDLPLPQVVPLHFHGIFCPQGEPGCVQN